MFLKNSRYYNVDTVEAEDRSGRDVTAVKLRRLESPSAKPLTVTDGDRLDVIAETSFRDATRFWHIADANTEMEANELVRVAGRTIQVPER